MLDRDLAELYGIETKRLKEAVRRNIERFEGEDFMVRLTPEEINELSRSQFATLNIGRGYNIKYAPFAFGELGVAMLSSVLKSTTAIEINRNIMRAFVAMKQFLIVPPESKIERLQNEMKELREYIEEAFTDYNDINEDTRMQIELINQALAELQVKNKEQIRKERPRIGFIRAEGPISDTASSRDMPVFSAKRGAQSSIMASIVVS